MSDPDARVSGTATKIPRSIAMGFAELETQCFDQWPEQWRQTGRQCFYAGVKFCMEACDSAAEMTPEAWKTYYADLHDEMTRFIELTLAEARRDAEGQPP